jgi:hypothetical protein
MPDTVATALIAAVSAVAGGVLTAVVGPLVKHRAERKSALEARRREQLAQWRAMLLDVTSRTKYLNEIGQALQLHPHYMSLEPLLSEETKRSLYGDNRTMVVGHSLPAPLENVKREIANIEKAWRLS